MDIGKSFSYIFEDPRWVTKLLVGTLVLIASSLLMFVLVGILGYFIVMGYALETLRNVRNGETTPMPEWRDRWGEWLVAGFKLFVATFVWALPAVIFGFLMFVPAIMMDSNQDFWAAMGGLGLVCLSCLMFLWVIVVLLAQPAIYIRVAEKDSIGAALQFGSMLRFTREHIGDVLVATIVYVIAALVVSTVGSLVGTLLCFVGLFVTIPLASLITYLIQAHLYAQVGQRAVPGTALAPSGVTAVAPAAPVAPATQVVPIEEPAAPPAPVAAAEEPAAPVADDAPPAEDAQ